MHFWAIGAGAGVGVGVGFEVGAGLQAAAVQEASLAHLSLSLAPSLRISKTPLTYHLYRYTKQFLLKLLLALQNSKDHVGK